jgi:hypothetical protein
VLAQRVKQRRATLLACVAALALTSVTAAAGRSTQTPPGRFLTGVTLAGADLSAQAAAVDAFTGRRQAVVAVWLDQFGTGSQPAVQATIDSALTTVWTDGYVPMLTWLVPMVSEQMASGADDGYLRSVAAELKAWLAGPDRRYGDHDDRRLYLRPSPEANATGCGYCVIGTAIRTPDPVYQHQVNTFKSNWARFYRLFRSAGMDPDRLQIVFAVNNVDGYRSRSLTDSRPEPVAEDIYPGNAVTDWSGLDGYRWTSEQTPHDVFDPMLRRLLAITHGHKPLAITEWGAYPDGGIEAKNAYLRQFFGWLTHQPIRMAIYWNGPDYSSTPALEILGPDAPCDRRYTYRGRVNLACTGYQLGVQSDRGAVSARRSLVRRLTTNDFTGATQ